MKTAVFQFPVTGNTSENLTKMQNAIRQASEAGTRLLVFPECALTGYPPRDISSSAAVDYALLDEAHKELQALADHYRMVLIVGTMMRAEQGIYNTALVFRPGGKPVPYHKRALWGWDRDNFVPGNEPGIVEIDGIRIGIRICFEVRFPEYFRELYRQHTDLNVVLFYDVTDGDSAGRYDLLRGHIRTRAVENVCFTLSVNTACPGQSAPTMLAGRSGGVPVEGEREREALLTFDFALGPLDFGELGRKEYSDELC